MSSDTLLRSKFGVSSVVVVVGGAFVTGLDAEESALLPYITKKKKCIFFSY